MSTRQKIIGQTGTTVLSDEKRQYNLAKRRTVRYWYVKRPHGYRVEVIGPFHSALYGACGFGTKRSSAKAALQRNLANNYRYIGTMLVSNKDESDTVGIVNERLLDDNATTRPITFQDAVAIAGQ